MYVLPQMKSRPGSIWIVKPPGEMCGNGIRLVTEPNQVLDRRLVYVRWKDPGHADIFYPRSRGYVFTTLFLYQNIKL